MKQNDVNDRPLRVLPWWVALVGAVAVAVSITVTTLWLLSIAGSSRSLRIEAIKIGLTVGAGTGGAIALLLAIRRQWLSERAQAHAETIARGNVYDATQRRVTELYSKALEQLGHDRTAVRLGSLYALERLGQDNHEHRQTVVDVLCAYLRMPFKLSVGGEADGDGNGNSRAVSNSFQIANSTLKKATSWSCRSGWQLNESLPDTSKQAQASPVRSTILMCTG